MTRRQKSVLLHAANTLLWALVIWYLYSSTDADPFGRAFAQWYIAFFTLFFAVMTAAALLAELMQPGKGLAFGCALPFTAISLLLLAVFLANRIFG